MNPLSKQYGNHLHKTLNMHTKPTDADKASVEAYANELNQAAAKLPPSEGEPKLKLPELLRKRVAAIEGNIPVGASLLLTRIDVDKFKIQLVRVDEPNRVVPIEVLAGKLEETTAKVDFPNLKPIPGANFYAASMVPSPTQFGAHQDKGLLKRLQGMLRFLGWIWRGGHPSDFPPSATSVNRGFDVG